MSGPDVVPFAVFGAAIILAAAGGFCIGCLMQSNAQAVVALRQEILTPTHNET